MVVTDCGHAKRKVGNLQHEKCKKRCIYPPNYVLCPLSAPILSPNTGTPCQELVIIPGKLYTVGRSKSTCDIIFEDSRVSRQHCQLYSDSEQNKLFLLDGTILPPKKNKHVQIFQSAVKQKMAFSVNKNGRCEMPEISLIKYVKTSLNGIFVNGKLVKLGHFRVLSVGDEVSLVCDHSMDPTFQPAVGFVVKVNYNGSPVIGGDGCDSKINVQSPCQATSSGTMLSCGLDCAKAVDPIPVDALKDSGMCGNKDRTETLNKNRTETLKESFTSTGVSKPRKEIGLSRTLTGKLLEASQKLRHSLLCNQENWQIRSCHEISPPVCSGHLNLMNKHHSQNFESREEKVEPSTQLDMPKLKAMERSSRLDFQINLTKYTTEDKQNDMAYAVDGKSEQSYHDGLKEAHDGLCSAADMKKREATVKQTQERSITTHCKLGSGALSIPNKSPLLVNTSLDPLIKGKDSDNGVNPNHYSLNEDDKRVEQLISHASSLLRRCRTILRNDSVFDLKISSENPGHYLVDPSKNTEGCPGKNTDISQHISRNSDGFLCRSNMGNSKQYADSAHISILDSGAHNKRKENETWSIDNESNSILKASITEKQIDSRKVDENQRGTTFILDKLEKNSSTYSGKVYSETDPKSIDKPIIENLCKNVTPDCTDRSKQLKLSRSNSNLIKAEQQCSCSNENGQDALSLRKLQEEINELHIMNRFCSEAVLSPPNEECREYHEDVAVVFTKETHLAKQATSREGNILYGVYPSKDEVGRSTDQETDVEDIHALQKGICAEVFEDQINSIDSERRKKSSKDLQHGKAELTKDFSVNNPSLLSRKSFCLNQLEFMEPNSGKNGGTVSLKDLLIPVDNLLGIFCATFTADILWFLSSCKVPKHLPVTIACHNSERCWSRCNDQRWSRPYADWPNLTVVYPPFPDSIAFTKGKRQGVGCHHPKILLLHRRDIMRVIITSANLGPNQWLHVTNTVWWQDFPRRSTQDYLSLFCPAVPGSKNIVNGDFAAQLAGFLATLIAGVPAEAYWIAELAHYDFRRAAGYLVASVPGMHGCPHPYPQLSVKFQTGISKCTNWRSSSARYLGIVPTSVVGLSYRFCSAADPKGARLKSLARVLGGSRGDMEGLIPVLLKRTHNISADPNAVSVIVCDINSSCEDLFLEEDLLTNYSPTKFLDAGYVHLGFLQKDVAEWIAALWDAGIFSFSACICPQEALATASGRSNNKVQLILYVFQGENFAQLSEMPMSYKHGVSICSLLSSLQRPFGLWRLQEVLSQYKWPDSLETDFIYGSSSIGTSLDAHFLAAFSAAAGKRSIPSSVSDESDPEWGCWDAQHESESPSIGIVFPTIQRVQYAKEGIHAHSRLLCFAESTWERLKSANLLHDAIPYPRERIGFPMHVKVARRRFQYFSNAPSFGWIYCGSHNFSPAAWGRPLFKPSESKAATGAGSVLGSTLRICNYEIGLVFIVPPPEDLSCTTKKHGDLDRFILPFVVPAPKYQESDRPATAKAIREARIEMLKLEQLEEKRTVEYLELEEVPDEGELPNEDACKESSDDDGQQEEEEEKAYAETLWSQLDSCHL